LGARITKDHIHLAFCLLLFIFASKIEAGMMSPNRYGIVSKEKIKYDE
jgi:hypothetical protein